MPILASETNVAVMGKLEKSLFIVEQLSGGKRLSLREINERFRRSSMYDDDILPRTMSRYRDFVLDSWGIIVEYDFSEGVYYIDNEEYADQTELYKFLLASIRVSNLATQIMRCRDRVHFTQVSTGTGNIYPILTALESKKTIEFDYCSFSSSESRHHDRFPCFIQEWEGRWYLVAEHQNHKTPTVFALERMSNVSVGKVEGVSQTSVNPDVYFAGSFGINHDVTIPVQEVRIKFYDSQVGYVKAKPLHPSQKEIAMGNGWTVFSYNLALCYNFYQQVLWHREKAEIIWPEEARQEMGRIISEIGKMY